MVDVKNDRADLRPSISEVRRYLDSQPMMEKRAVGPNDDMEE
jgi:hypothetical protein